MVRPRAIKKELSRNDTGETGGHQAGILIPKQKEILAFFPPLDPSEKNPRHFITFSDELGDTWTFAFIYYNNKFFNGTRNEYRLTRMTPFIRSHNLKEGDELTLSRDDEGFYSITYNRKRPCNVTGEGKLILGSSWVVINM